METIRDIGLDIKGVPHTFSSWNTCMTKMYCKWPAIVGILIGSLIVLSILFCVGSCLARGGRCCCDCCSCLTRCCRGSSRPHQTVVYQQPPPQQYAPPAQPVYQSPAQPVSQSQAPPPYQAAAPPSRPPVVPVPLKSVNDDALPHMPSWDTSTSRRVEEIPLQEQQPYAGQQSHTPAYGHEPHPAAYEQQPHIAAHGQQSHTAAYAQQHHPLAQNQPAPHLQDPMDYHSGYPQQQYASQAANPMTRSHHDYAYLPNNPYGQAEVGACEDRYQAYEPQWANTRPVYTSTGGAPAQSSMPARKPLQGTLPDV
ncbi:hypothetical protein K470DRAFT_265499 [Piedraia hortae CBS 480.64]|uniref:Uncharacterized protein n=1 Tax=Piedraia hortae CBS 480.64 TaxID=1314780 RepID=A0A6A7BV52_9PEZI|nr:hypothetical protein K470DRAFT_265499 [Piedraia hortae CBS 480.64]